MRSQRADEIRRPLVSRMQDGGMAALTLPKHLVATARRSRSPELRQWVAGLPDIVQNVAERWSLCLGEPYQPGGGCS